MKWLLILWMGSIYGSTTGSNLTITSSTSTNSVVTSGCYSAQYGAIPCPPPARIDPEFKMVGPMDRESCFKAAEAIKKTGTEIHAACEAQ